ncbi:hypothetical protein OGAPHI_005463 [Ogataea philodendri]|uniref:Uncharacterized protein n=1 Tax=Ogataea philodendri TaxID=1378263 RepID=A0A9P8NZ82_9ASCO|nr:uncharacterized protein OGAPHI_005463 [Ogataea philodendri]KAH3662215.1 hypothetical protein OGAPHI_005463 [Ogataea philodendri]
MMFLHDQFCIVDNKELDQFSNSIYCSEECQAKDSLYDSSVKVLPNTSKLVTYSTTNFKTPFQDTTEEYDGDFFALEDVHTNSYTTASETSSRRSTHSGSLPSLLDDTPALDLYDADETVEVHHCDLQDWTQPGLVDFGDRWLYEAPKLQDDSWGRKLTRQPSPSATRPSADSASHNYQLWLSRVK